MGSVPPIIGRIADTYGIGLALNSTYLLLAVAILLCFFLPLNTMAPEKVNEENMSGP